MKPQIICRQIDLVGQGLMLLPIVALVAPEARGYAFFTYFTVGFWQAASCGMNRLMHGRSDNCDRRAYERMLAWVLGVGLLCAAGVWVDEAFGITLGGLTSVLGGVLMLEGVFLLLLSPFMAIWYARITMDELAQMRGAVRHRTEVHWKL